MAITASKGQVNSTPNVTPMVDVMLVLLIIFMVVTPALMAGFNAKPPEGVNLKDHPEDEELDQVLGIDRTGVYYLNKKEIASDDLPRLIKSIYDARTVDKILYLKADKELEYAKVLDAMDIAAKNGVRMVAMISEQRQGTISSVEGDIQEPPPGGK